MLAAYHVRDADEHRERSMDAYGSGVGVGVRLGLGLDPNRGARMVDGRSAGLEGVGRWRATRVQC